MNAEQLMEAMGELDASLVEETFDTPAPEKRRPARFWLRFAAAAAVFVLVAGGVWAAVSRLPSPKSGVAVHTPAESETEAPAADVSAAAPAATQAPNAAPTGTFSVETAPAEAPQQKASSAAATSVPEATTTALKNAPTNTAAPTTQSAAEAAATAAHTNAPTNAAASTAVVPPVPETAAPTTQPAAEPAAPSWWARVFGNTGDVLGEREDSLLQRIADLFSVGSPSGAGESGNETASPTDESPADCYHPFYRDFAALENRAAAYRSMPVTEKTQAELEEIYGGPFLPTVFPGAGSPPQDSSGAPHGVRRQPTGETVAFNEYLFVWTLPEGGSLSLSMTVDDGGYFPSVTIEDMCRTYRARSAAVYWLADTIDGAPRRLAIAARDENVVFTFTLTGECGDEDFLRLVSSALGC